MSNTKQTAVEWLSDKMVELLGDKCNEFTTEETLKCHYIFKQAKQMEKEQILNAFVKGWETIDTDLTSNTYYTQTYQAFKGELIQDEIGNLIPKNYGK